LAMHGREHVLIVRSGGKGLIAHTMFYEDEVRGESEFDTRVDDVSPKELQLAKSFVEAIAGPFNPAEFKDSHREKLKAAIAGKTERGEVARGSSGSGSVSNATPPTLDIMEALKKSLEMRSAVQPPRKAVSKAHSTKGPRKKRSA